MALASNPYVVHSGDGGTPYVKDYPEAASQSFLAGELVYLSSGSVTVCVSDATTILGRAMEAASGTTGTMIQVEVFRPGDEIMLPVTNDGTAATCDGLTLFTKYGIYVSSNVHYIDVNDTTNDAFTPIKYVYTDATEGTYDYWVIGNIVPAASQYHSGA